ncbi:DUF4296 domain-containing protein [Mesonia sp.]|uniref:DUF4296 domain-containing protein n=1 Tax=Mesonia sp. TaxID=1960830 RepID=UPI00175E6E25|nr:DUF4296 domain-containing protein [Mesonia sp.]HIB36558.1 DUF4296 domain-containing protein [Mesonia sp.]HIO27248.1 DUF4296 domain-containing protein [Flavobacteriaceae bacterium]
MKKSAYILFSFILLVFAACQNVDHAEKPENLIAEDKMIDVLTDLLKLDAAEGFSSIEYEKREVKTKELIFEKYKIDSLQFVNSVEYYAEDFKTNERIYSEVQDRLEAEKKELDSLVEAEKKEKKNKKAELKKEIEPKEEGDKKPVFKSTTSILKEDTRS